MSKIKVHYTIHDKEHPIAFYTIRDAYVNGRITKEEIAEKYELHPAAQAEIDSLTARKLEPAKIDIQSKAEDFIQA